MTVSRAEQIRLAERRRQLVDNRRKKVPYREFYKEIGYNSESEARKDFYRTLAEAKAAEHETVEIYREEQLLELDGLAEVAHELLREDYYLVSQGGKTIAHPISGEPMRDPGPKYAAIDRILKISGQVAKLRGTEAATKIEGAFTLEALDKALADARRQLADLGTEDPEDGGTSTPPS
ncbi:hypothetical protein [Streptantibioticus silvisoli]|uniref:Terminase small subunit n=1 Tax=Streptantibioticus silvisoli TaxID=2705255 RepID=A0ABT6W4P4_9ACTN|nr:hypothetical protein [Streptantibioticus silvisoli]MDI5965730.1 hypothetical protein [Streptantibioticus silvisoli]